MENRHPALTEHVPDITMTIRKKTVAGALPFAWSNTRDGSISTLSSDLLPYQTLSQNLFADH
jgi:hypothetical protein